MLKQCAGGIGLVPHNYVARILATCVASFDYAPAAGQPVANILSFSKGDRIKVFKKADDSWYTTLIQSSRSV
jgi:hypothetical protein